MFLQSCVNFRFHYFYFLYSIQHVYSGVLGRGCHLPVSAANKRPVSRSRDHSRPIRAPCHLPVCQQSQTWSRVFAKLPPDYDRGLFNAVFIRPLTIYTHYSCLVRVVLFYIHVWKEKFPFKETDLKIKSQIILQWIKQATFHFWAVQNCFILLDFPAVINNFLTRVDMGHLIEGKWPML